MRKLMILRYALEAVKVDMAPFLRSGYRNPSLSTTMLSFYQTLTAKIQECRNVEKQRCGTSFNHASIKT
jgi:hypothetical protein